MATAQQLDESMRDYIALGIAAANAQANIFTRPIVSQVNDGLLANLPESESITGQWFASNQKKFGWVYRDVQGQSVIFPQQPAQACGPMPMTPQQVDTMAVAILSAMITVAERDEVLPLNYRIEAQNCLAYIQSKLTEITAEVNSEDFQKKLAAVK